MDQLIATLEKIEDMDYLIAELNACDREIETVDDLVDYLKDELSYAN